jgi:hypothetical protein
LLRQHPLPVRRRDGDERQGRRAERHAQRHAQLGHQVRRRSDADDRAIHEQVDQRDEPLKR